MHLLLCDGLGRRVSNIDQAVQSRYYNFEEIEVSVGLQMDCGREL
jgi:hypothetical protein